MRTEATYQSSKLSPERSGDASSQGRETENTRSTEQVLRNLELSLDELLRMESEGGSSIAEAQSGKIKRLSEEIHRINTSLHAEKQDSSHFENVPLPRKGEAQ